MDSTFRQAPYLDLRDLIIFKFREGFLIALLDTISLDYIAIGIHNIYSLIWESS